MNFLDIFQNRVLLYAGLAWFIAQVIKVPLYYLWKRRWNWPLLLSPGGLPSSHSALVSAAAHGIGLYAGFDSPVYAAAFIIAAVVIYDATGIRRQAGKHARIINTIISDMASGHPLKEEQLREVLGHTPVEAIAGTLWGALVAQIAYMLWG